MEDDYISKNGLLYSPNAKNVVSIDDRFRESLEEAKLPQEQTELPPYLFSGCESLKKVIMPLSVTSFPEGLFQGCSSLVDIPFRAGIDEIYEKTFEYCTSLKSIVFPNTINAIRSRACGDCINLETVILPPKMYALADDAFEGCINIHNIRIDSGNKLFYISDKDGCLYERNVDGDDILKIRVYKVENDKVEFFKENVDDETDNFFTDEDIDEEDDTFSSEIENVENKNVEVGDEKMDADNVDEMLADIMGAEKERNEVSQDIGISDKESAVLSEMMDVMSESSLNKGKSVSDDELVNLFAEPESVEEQKKEVNIEVLDSKSQILVDSASNSKVIICDTAGESPEDFDLFVISEREEFSPKLIACVEKIARIQDLKRIIMVSGLPIDNDEFMQFYFHFMNMRNVVVACLAESPSSLSDYCKTICEQSRISLEKEEIIAQRKRIGVKNNNLIKLIVRDVE